MPKKKILYISGSLGLGHVTRDVAVARELRKLIPDVKLSWLASNPASLVLKDAGEKLLSESDLYANDNIPAENVSEDFGLNLMKYMFNARKEWANNVKIFRKVMNKESFDLVIGDETYEIVIALLNKSLIIKPTFVMIYDFFGTDTTTKSPFERLVAEISIRKFLKVVPENVVTNFFMGEEENILDKKLGFFLPNRREWVKKAQFKFLGYIIPFDPAEYTDKAKNRAKLGYGKEPLVVCSIGGTKVGKVLLELCGQAYPIIREEIPDLRMVLVCGPRLPADSLKVPQGIEVKGYVPALHEHFAASDLAIVNCGGTSTLELTALRRPFLYFPLEGHYEQEIHMAGRLARHRAGVKMTYSKTTPKSLAKVVISNIGKEVNYAIIPTDGAQKAAQLINQLL